MDKQKQIDEMARIMFENAFENYKTSGGYHWEEITEGNV